MKLKSGGTAISNVSTTEADMGLKVNVGVRPKDRIETTTDHLFEGKVKFTDVLGEVTLLYFEQ